MPINIYNPPPSEWYLVEGDAYNWGVQVNTFGGVGYIYVSRVRVSAPFKATQYRFYVDVQSGNYDVGLYTGSLGALSLFWSIGSTPVPTAGLTTPSISPSITIPPGYYWTAFGCDNTTAKFSYSNITGGHLGPVFPRVNVTGIFPLPLTISSSFTTTDRRYGPVFINGNAPTF